MNKWVVIVSLVLGAGSTCCAQQPSSDSTTPAAPAPSTAPAAPSRELSFGSHDAYRLQLSMGYAYVHFRSAPFSAQMSGLNTQAVYRLKDWVAVEGSVTAAFDSTIYGHAFDWVKYASYGGGGRVNWQGHRWVPYAHALAGGIHVQPQTALGGRTAFAYTVGGGADWRWKPGISLRAQGDWVRSMLYHQAQNNIQIVAGIVFHF